jgi:type II secretory pathway component PulM
MSRIQEYLQAWYASLSGLHQKILVWVMLAMLALALYFQLWAPVAEDMALQHQRVLDAEQDLRWLRQTGAEIRALRGQNHQSLPEILGPTLKQYNLRPDSNKYDAKVNEWRLRFKATDFRQLLLWLNQLRRQSTVVIALANISREPTGGVNARFVLTENQ